jgi:hypothetical protein
MIDFTPYAIGKNIQEGMITPENAPKWVYEDIWVYEVNGVEKEYSTEEKPWTIAGANFVDRKTKVVKEGYTPPIQDFTMELNGNDIKDLLLMEDRLILVVMYNIEKSREKGLRKLKKFTDKAMQNGYRVYAFSASPPEEFAELRLKYQWDFDLLFCDETTLKTIIRGNPGIVLLNKGTIEGKWNWRDFKDIELKAVPYEGF